MLERPKMPTYIEKLLGQENIERLIAVMFHNEVIDLDYLFLTDELTYDELSQYVHQLPEFGSLVRAIDEIAEAMLEHFFSDKGRVLNWLDRSFVIHKKQTGGREMTLSEEQGLEKFRQMIAEFMALFSYRGGRVGYRDLLIRKFVFKIVTGVAAKFYKLCAEREHGVEKRIVLGKYFDRRNLPSLKDNGPGLQIKEFVECELELSELAASHQAQFVKLASDLCADETTDLAEFKKKNLIQAGTAGALMRFRSCEKIIFKSVMIIPLKVFVKSGNQLIDEHTLLATFLLDPLADDPEKSKLFLNINFHGDINIGFLRMENYFDPLSCERLKSRIYDEIIKHLSTQPDKYEDLLIGHARSKKCVQAVRVEIGEDVGETLGETEADQSDLADGLLNRGREFWVKHFRKREPEMGLDVAPTDVVDTIRVRLDMTRFDNLSGDEVLRMATRLLGKPVKISGSHHVFKNSEGRKGTIPIHGSHTVNRYILVDVLGKLGVLEDFHDELS